MVSFEAYLDMQSQSCRSAVLGGSWVLITTMMSPVITYSHDLLRGLISTVCNWGYKHPEPPSSTIARRELHDSPSCKVAAGVRV